MISKLIAFCVDNRFLVMILAAIVAVAGVWSTYTIPIDAIPDLSDVQVIIYTPWEGRDPQTVEDQLTYPLTTTMLSVPGVKDVRGQSFFGFSFVYVIFEDGTDMYWARSRVLEYMNQVQGQLPEDVTPRIGPDATGLGWVYIYTLEDTKNNYDLGELRALQDWYVRYQLTGVEGVAEVASVGGAVRQYQVEVDPRKLLLYQVPLEAVIGAVKDSNNDVGGRVIEMAETEHMIRSSGYIRDVRDLEKIVLSANEDGTPVLLSDVANIQLGPDMKRGIAEKNGQGEVVAGIVVMRYGENALTTIEAVKEKIEQIESGLPDGVVVRSAYDRSALIQRSVDTLKHTLAQELMITAAICLIFLLHVRSGLVAAAVLPLGILMAFIVMRWLGINANIMSISGIAVAIGTMVDSSIVMVENLHKHKERSEEKGEGRADHWETVKIAAKEVGPGLFVALLVITVSFLPVFFLQGQGGRLFKPLAYTKTFAMAAAALVAVTVIPLLMGYFVRGRTPKESSNPLNRLIMGLYLPVIRFALRNKLLSIGIAVLLLAASLLPLLQLLSGPVGGIPVVGPPLQAGIQQALKVPLLARMQIGSEFMPPLREGDILYMPTSLPGLSVTEARRTLQIQDQLLVQFPEVRTVLGKIGRATTPTDPAPLNMVETHASLRPEEDWPKRLIEKGYLERLGRQMLSQLADAGLLAKPVVFHRPGDEDLKGSVIAEQLEGMTRAEINRRTRMRLMEALGEELPETRQAYEQHRERLIERGETPRSRFREQELEDRWAADILKHAMDRIRPQLPAEIVERTTQNLVDILESQGGLSSDGKDEALEILKDRWSPRIATDDIPLVATTFEELTGEEMQREIKIPGMPNWWLMPIETRIGMLTTGMKGDVGIKLFGTDLDKLSETANKLEKLLKDLPETEDAVAERPTAGRYVDIDVDRDECARYGIKVGDVQRMIETAVGGMTVTSTVEGRYRFPINVRYPPELRDDPQKLRRVLIRTSRGNLIPLNQVADISLVDGPPMIKSENGMLLVNIPVVVAEGLDMGTYVSRAQAAINRAIATGDLKMPAGYYTEWSGKYQMMRETNQRMMLIVPMVVVLIFVLVYVQMKNVTETAITIGTLVFAAIGGIWAMSWLGYNDSVATRIGFIALLGLAAETTIIMHVYLDLSYEQFRREKGGPLTPKELHEAVIDGAVLRVRPKLMTVLTDFIALLPILWATTPGAGPMKRIAIPVIGGVITSAVHTLILIPVYFTLYKRWEQWRERRHDGDSDAEHQRDEEPQSVVSDSS